MLSPMSLSPELDIFTNVFKSFINAFVYSSSSTTRLEAKQLLHGLFLNTGVFNENSKLEIDIWLEPLRYFDKKTVKVVSKVFLQAFQAPKDLLLDIPNEDIGTSSKINLQNLFENIENNLSVQGYVEHIEISKLLLTILKGVTVGDSLRKYLELVNVLLYHYLPQNKVLNAILRTEDGAFSNFHKYSKNWLKKTTTIEALDLIPHLDEVIQQATKGTLNMRDLFKVTDENKFIPMNFIGESEPINLSEELSNDTLLLLYIFNALSVVNRLFELETLQETQSKALSNFIGDCFEILDYLEEAHDNEVDNSERPTENILKYIYNNNVQVLQNFRLFPESESSKSYLIFIENLTSRLHCPKLGSFTALFRQKIVNEIKVAVKHSLTTNYDMLKIIEVFHLTVDECTQILESIGSLKFSQIVDRASGIKTVFFDILVIVLNRLSELKTSISEKDCVKKIGQLYKKILSKVEVDNTFEKLEEALVNFLSVSHQRIEDFCSEEDVFNNIFCHKRVSFRISS